MSVVFAFDRLPARSLGLVLAGLIGWGPAAGSAQPPEGTEIGSLFPTQRQNKPSEPAAETPATDALPQDGSVRRWLDGLGADRFAARERAAAKLLQLGPEVLPALRRLEQNSDDPEVRLRAARLAEQLSRGNLQARIDAFLAGEPVQFEGWQVARAILGDSPSVRQLFTEMLRSHPQLVQSLAGAPRDRTAAMEMVMVKVQRGMLFQQRLPDAADAFALLLPANDPNVPMSHAYTDAVLSVLRQSVASQLNQDPQLAAPFRALVGGWVKRTSLSHRQDVLVFSLNWEIPEALPLAIKTLSETREPQTLVLALQTIARFGSAEDAQAVAPLLDDSRRASPRGFSSQQTLPPQIGDVAMATIAILNDLPVVSVGFAQPAEHPKYGLVVDDLAFPDAQARQAARQKIDQILSGQTAES